MFKDNISLYKVFNNIIRVAKVLPPSELAIRSFAVIDVYQIIQDEQVGKTLLEKDKPFFFSQEWRAKGYPSNNISFEYPLLAIREIGDNVTDPFSSAKKSTHSFDILLVDKLYLESTSQKNVLQKRNQYQIYNDCRYLLKTFLETLSTVRAYLYNSEIVYLPYGYVNNLTNSVDYVEDSNLTMKFNTKLTLTADYNISNFWGTGNNLYGVNIPNFNVLLDPCVLDVVEMRNTETPIV